MILMDIRLPDMDGIALTRKLKSAPHLADIPVLMLTATLVERTLAESLGPEPSAHRKPFKRDRLLQQLRGLCTFGLLAPRSTR